MATDNKHSNARFSWSGSIPHSLPTTNLADFTNTLTKSTTKVTDKLFPEWNDQADSAFQGVKKLVPSVDCLTTIDHEHPGDNKIFLHILSLKIQLIKLLGKVFDEYELKQLLKVEVLNEVAL